MRSAVIVDAVRTASGRGKPGGARLLTTMVSHLEATGGRYGLQTMCESGGMANATIIERLG
jgi:acetyl-CoA acetyltransferase